MNDSLFKIGDEVVCVNNSQPQYGPKGGGWILGAKFIVAEVENYKDYLYVYWPSHKKWGVCEEYLKLTSGWDE